MEQAGLSDKILLPGHTNDAWTALAAMDLFVLTSRIEGLPNVVIEAQAMGVPVVATDVGGTREALIDGETGWAISEHTPQALAKACLDLLDDPKKRLEAGSRATRYARATFSLESMIDHTLATYAEALRRAGCVGADDTLLGAKRPVPEDRPQVPGPRA